VNAAVRAIPSRQHNHGASANAQLQQQSTGRDYGTDARTLGLKDARPSVFHLISLKSTQRPPRVAQWTYAGDQY